MERRPEKSGEREGKTVLDGVGWAVAPADGPAALPGANGGLAKPNFRELFCRRFWFGWRRWFLKLFGGSCWFW